MIYRVASRKAPRGLFSQVIYCRGYSGEEPPLPIPNREVKLTIADGTAPPGGRVGSCGSSKALKVDDLQGFFVEEPQLPLSTCPHPPTPSLGEGELVASLRKGVGIASLRKCG